jgi:hypothetical protein
MPATIRGHRIDTDNAANQSGNMQIFQTPCAKNFTEHRGAIFASGLAVAIEHAQFENGNLETYFRPGAINHCTLPHVNSCSRTIKRNAATTESGTAPPSQRDTHDWVVSIRFAISACERLNGSERSRVMISGIVFMQKFYAISHDLQIKSHDLFGHD